MMDELENSWRKLALIEQEQDVVEIDEIGENLGADGKYFLVGSLWTTRMFNNQAMLGPMKSLWRPRKGMNADILSDKRFLFTFY